MTVTVNTWVAAPYLCLAVRVSGHTPAAALRGVPGDRGHTVFVVSETHAHRTTRPVLVTVGARTPVVTTQKANAAPQAAVAAEPPGKGGRLCDHGGRDRHGIRG